MLLDILLFSLLKNMIKDIPYRHVAYADTSIVQCTHWSLKYKCLNQWKHSGTLYAPNCYIFLVIKATTRLKDNNSLVDMLSKPRHTFFTLKATNRHFLPEICDIDLLLRTGSTSVQTESKIDTFLDTDLIRMIYSVINC